VPRSDIGSPADGSILYGLTGYTGDTLASANVSTVDGIPIAFFDNADQTAPIDALVSSSAVTPEIPSLALLALLGVATATTVGYLRRRRRAGRSRGI
jgi:hypothetical protein